MKVTILHPFTPDVVGLNESEFLKYHSKPHVNALKKFAQVNDMECYMEYFTAKKKSYSTIENDINYKFYPVSYSLKGDHRKWKKQYSRLYFKSFKNSPTDVTIINMSAHSSKFSYCLAKLIKKKGKQYIAMLGGQHYSDHRENRNYYKGAHHILVHTKNQKLKMEEMQMFKGLDIRVLPLGIDCEEFFPKINKGIGCNLLFVGRIVRLKRIELSIRALKILKDNNFNGHLTILGPTSSDEYFNELRVLIETYGLSNDVTFVGQKNHNELLQYFQNADLLTLPSKSESFGMVMIESMACGTPVAAIEGSGGPDEIISHLHNGILTNVENYCNEILKFFLNEEDRVDIGANARAKVIQQYNINRTYEILEKSIFDALS